MVLASIGSAAAQGGPACVDGLVTDEPSNAQPGVVTANQARAYFHKGREGGDRCPSTDAACRGSAYLVPADKVIIAPVTVSGFVCAAYLDRRGRATVGWLPANAVEMGASRSSKLADWLGTWSYYNSTIAIARGKARDTLKLEGDATVQRLNSVNTGGFSAEVAPHANALAFADLGGETVPIEQAEESSCALKMALIDDVLVVSDFGNCGGAGVNFTGYYRRRR